MLLKDLNIGLLELRIEFARRLHQYQKLWLQKINFMLLRLTLLVLLLFNFYANDYFKQSQFKNT